MSRSFLQSADTLCFQKIMSALFLLVSMRQMPLDASGMQMLDVKNRCWSQEILDFLKVDRELLGDVYESPEVVGNLLPKIAEKCGLSTEQLMVAGGVIMPVQQLEQVL